MIHPPQGLLLGEGWTPTTAELTPNALVVESDNL
jgi:hypothetical protein